MHIDSSELVTTDSQKFIKHKFYLYKSDLKIKFKGIHLGYENIPCGHTHPRAHTDTLTHCSQAPN